MFQGPRFPEYFLQKPDSHAPVKRGMTITQSGQVNIITAAYTRCFRAYVCVCECGSVCESACMHAHMCVCVYMRAHQTSEYTTCMVYAHHKYILLQQTF